MKEILSGEVELKKIDGAFAVLSLEGIAGTVRVPVVDLGQLTIEPSLETVQGIFSIKAAVMPKR